MVILPCNFEAAPRRRLSVSFGRATAADRGAHVGMTRVIKHAEIGIAQTSDLVNDGENFGGLLKAARLELPAHPNTTVSRELGASVHA